MVNFGIFTLDSAFALIVHRAMGGARNRQFLHR